MNASSHRTPRGAVLDVPHPAYSRIDALVEVLLGALLALLPLAFGTVAAWSEALMLAVVAAAALAVAVKFLARPDVPVVRTWVYLPIALFVLLAALQLLPLPAGVVRVVSPETARLAEELLADAPGGPPRWIPLSLYPRETRHDLRLILAGAAVFAVVVNTYRRPEQIRRLLATVTVLGGVLAVLAVAQVLTGATEIYWLVPTEVGVANAGPFVHHSHFSQFMNLCLGAAMALLLVRVQEVFRLREVTLGAVYDRMRSPGMRWVWLAAAVIVVGALSICLSLSRGGILSLLVAGTFTALALSVRRGVRGRGWILAVLAILTVVGVLGVGFDSVYARMETLGDAAEYHGRLRILRDLAEPIRRFPVFGVGLGTHEFVYPMYERSMMSGATSHAENEYAQLAEETGLLGLGFVLAFAVALWRRYGRAIRHGSAPICAAAYGLGFGLLAIQVHSLSDFGQHLPANALLTAVTGALLVVLARLRTAPVSPVLPAAAGTRGSRPLRLAGLALVAALSVWVLLGADAARRAEAHWRKAARFERKLDQTGWEATDADRRILLGSIGAAIADEPDNVLYRLTHARYRRNLLLGPDVPARPAAWSAGRQEAQAIVADLKAARALCPVFAPLYWQAGEIEYFALGQRAGAADVERGYALASCHPAACYLAGTVDVLEGRPDGSVEKFRRALDLNGAHFYEMVRLYLRPPERPDLVLALCAGDTIRLAWAAGELERGGRYVTHAAEARSQVVSLLRAQCEDPDAPPNALASLAHICAQQGDYDGAVGYYRRALALDYGQVRWRLAMARALRDAGRTREAMDQARICLRLEPDSAPARRMIEELSLLSPQAAAQPPH